VIRLSPFQRSPRDEQRHERLQLVHREPGRELDSASVRAAISIASCSISRCTFGAIGDALAVQEQLAVVALEPHAGTGAEERHESACQFSSCVRKLACRTE